MQNQLDMAMNRIINLEGEITQIRQKAQGGHQKTLDQMFFEPKGLMPEPLTQEMYSKVDKFRDWSLQVRDLLGIYSDDIHTILRGVEGTKDPLTQEYQANTIDAGWNRRLCTLLLMKTKDQARIVIRHTPANGGLEAWRRLHRQFDTHTDERNVGDLVYLTQPPQAKNAGEVMNEIMKFEAARDRHAGRHSVEVNVFFLEHFRRLALLKIIPKSIMALLEGQLDRFETYDKLKTKIEESCFSAHLGSAPMLFRLNPAEEHQEEEDAPAYYWDEEQETFTVFTSKPKGKGKGKKGRGKGKGKSERIDGRTKEQKDKLTCFPCGRKGHEQWECFANTGADQALDQGPQGQI